MKVKEESEKVDLKLNIQKTNIMAFGPITLWQIDGETMETVRDFFFLGSKITADGNCSHEIKRHLLLGRKAMTNLDSILKNISLPTKVHLVKAMVFPVVMYGCQSCTIKKAECRRTDAFELCFWEKILESPLNCKEIQPVNPKGNQSWIFIGRTDTEAETAILWEELTHWTRPWCWERLKAGGEGDDRGRDGWMASLTQWTWVWASLGDSEGQGSLACCSPWGCKESDTTEWLKWLKVTEHTGKFCQVSGTSSLTYFRT